jgi:hypothetical protein
VVLEHEVGLKLQAAGDNLGRVRKVPAQLLWEALGEKVVCVVEATSLSGLCQTERLQDGLDLVLVLSTSAECACRVNDALDLPCCQSE